MGLLRDRWVSSHVCFVLPIPHCLPASAKPKKSCFFTQNNPILRIYGILTTCRLAAQREHPHQSLKRDSCALWRAQKGAGEGYFGSFEGFWGKELHKRGFRGREHHHYRNIKRNGKRERCLSLHVDFVLPIPHSPLCTAKPKLLIFHPK